MIKERVLKLSLKDALDLFGGIKWKFYEVDLENSQVRMEVPRGQNESYVVNVGFSLEPHGCQDIVKALSNSGWIEQTIQTRCED